MQRRPDHAGVIDEASRCRGRVPDLPVWMRRLDERRHRRARAESGGARRSRTRPPEGQVVFWVHAEVVRPQWRYKAFYRPFLRRMLRRADRIVVASPQVAESPRSCSRSQKCVVIPYATRPAITTRMTRGGSRSRCRDRGTAKPRRRAAGAVSSDEWSAYKGVDVLLRALRDVNARAVIVGDGPLRAASQQLAARPGPVGARAFRGEASPDELTALYNACDIFVLPSVTRAEAFGMVQIEAMACRKPVICTTCRRACHG